MITASGRHRRSTPLVRLLAQLGWQRDPDVWTVPCRDVDGRRARLLIRLSPAGITITTTATGPLRLTMRQVGDLRVATHDAMNTFGLLAGPDRDESPRNACRDEVPTTPLDCPAAQREVVHFEQPQRPTVRELRARLGTASAPTVVGS
ncbi:MAG: hypothetical protein ABR608_07425 [Pseudonocardiaceae bacterium]